MPLDHKDILELFAEAWDADKDNRDDALDDLKFLAGEQWDSRAKMAREQYNRPVITVNRLPQFVRQVTGDMRMNPVAIHVSPVDDDRDIAKAEIFEGIIRSIEYASGAINVRAHAFEGSAGIGIGHYRVNTKYVDGTVDQQDIVLERILNHLSVVWDPGSVKIDRSDARYCFLTDTMPRRSFEAKYPKAKAEDFPREMLEYWAEGDKVRVAEFWHLEPYERTLALTVEGETIDITGFKASDRKMISIAMTPDGKPRERSFTDYRVRQYIVSGAEIISGPNEWAGKFIPIVPAVGSEIPVDEKIVRHGIVRAAKDPQRLYNYYRSSQAELIGQQPRAPFLVTAAMIKGNESQWNTANVSPRPYLPYTPDPASPSAKPERMEPPVASPALWQEGALASDDMKATTGIYDAALGAKSNETSGRAIMARQREGDVGSFHYFDNFKMAVKREGEILLDLIPKIYDTERVIRIIGAEDEEPEYVTVNKESITETLNDLSVGRFDVRVSSGPAFSTMREEMRETLIQLAQAYPPLMGLAGDLMVGAYDFPKAKEIAERIKRTIPPQVLEDQPPQQGPDPAQEAMMAKAQADVQKTQAETADKAASAKGKEIDNAARMMMFNAPPVQIPG